MTQEEFKAWFAGFSENITDQPTAAQWQRVIQRAKEITGSPITERIFIVRYDPYRYYPRWNEVTCAVSTTFAGNAVPHTPLAPWDGTVAMFALGAAEAKAV